LLEHPRTNRNILLALEELSQNWISNKLKVREQDYPKVQSVKVREIETKDAAYVLSLRSDPNYNRHLSPVENSIPAQELYINSYKKQNIPSRSSYYFIIENVLKDIPCGTVRIYNFNGLSFEWGSWILDKNKTRHAALEIAIFVYSFAFQRLGFEYSEFEVNKLNKNVLSFHIKSGAEIISSDEQNFYFRFMRSQALEFVNRLKNIIQKNVR